MPMRLTPELKLRLKTLGIESFHHPNALISEQAILEPPCSIKWMQIESVFEMGAFSYAVSGFYSHVKIGRYTSIGEQVQLGRASHPIDWTSTSPFFYIQQPLFDVGSDFANADDYHRFRPKVKPTSPPTSFKLVEVGHDVYIGHGAFIMPGVKIGHGAVVAAMSVVTKDVPSYSIVAGNPATVKRLRFSPELVERLLSCQWWNFAPWQLSDLDMHDPQSMLLTLEQRLSSTQPYLPSKVVLKQLQSL